MFNILLYLCTCAYKTSGFFIVENKQPVCRFFHINVLICFIETSLFSLRGEQGQRGWGLKSPLTGGSVLNRSFVAHALLRVPEVGAIARSARPGRGRRCPRGSVAASPDWSPVRSAPQPAGSLSRCEVTVLSRCEVTEESGEQITNRATLNSFFGQVPPSGRQ